MRKTALPFLLPALLILPLFMVACGGGHDSAPAAAPAAPATGIAYTNPTGSGWRLVKDAASTPTRLLLNLLGPTGLKTRGAGFNLVAPSGITFGNFTESGFPIKDMGTYELWNTDPWPGDGSVTPGSDPLEPKLLAGGVKAGNLLTVGIFQKDRRATAKESGRPLCQIALEFDPASPLKAGDPIPLSITKAKHMAEDIGAFAVSPTWEMTQKAVLVEMTIAVGELRAK
ncbi:MAG TPA: hypothetical protein VJ486_00785 [Geothrix sp.]|nr:hypothetical protein [Geothrix sp.]